LSLGEDRFFTRNANTTMADYNSAVIVEVDKPLGSFFGYVFDGIYQTEEEVASIDHPGARPGAVKFRDVNQDGVINAADRVNLGDANPAFYYGITNNFVYKGWDLSIFVQGVQGGQILNLTNARLSLPGLSNSLVSSLDYWTGPGTSNVNPAAGETFGLMSDRFLEDASYLRVKNVMLGYTFSPSLLEKIKIRNLRIYMSAVNLLTLTKYSGFDPEVNAKGDNNVIMNLDHGGFPAVKTYTLGINFGL